MHWVLLACTATEQLIIEKWPVLVIITIHEMNRRVIATADTLAVTGYGGWGPRTEEFGCDWMDEGGVEWVLWWSRCDLSQLFSQSGVLGAL
ncbi:hypothetical protein C1H46_008693 [Malus baccata]|uniref:Uncharacterized protein n=1 Tax=Malus baccata TaxID=106549 RepID=A0A540N3T8_MALBA|nr:hypothetical protein C1H46_008693 [Malus baccata]